MERRMLFKVFFLLPKGVTEGMFQAHSTRHILPCEDKHRFESLLVSDERRLLLNRRELNVQSIGIASDFKPRPFLFLVIFVVR